eukprot:4842674-Pyramimonas_sp.AAC.1
MEATSRDLSNLISVDGRRSCGRAHSRSSLSDAFNSNEIELRISPELVPHGCRGIVDIARVEQ